jgi:hypothetical protein
MQFVCLVLNSFSFRAASKAAPQPGNFASALARDISRLESFTADLSGARKTQLFFEILFSDDSRMMSVDFKTMCKGSTPSSDRIFISCSAAIEPIAYAGCSTTVSGFFRCGAASKSSQPISAISPGIINPFSLIAFNAPITSKLFMTIKLSDAGGCVRAAFSLRDYPLQRRRRWHQ